MSVANRASSKGKAGDIQLADVGQEQVHLVISGRGLLPGGGTGQPAGIDGFIEMDHLHDLILNVAGPGQPVHPGDQGRSSDEDVAYSDLAAAVALSVVGGEPFDEDPGEINFPVQE